ncbi:MAG: glycosyltransferase family 2 protein [Ruminococcus sp.]|uniref:glycosyltransferase family 2 protein n=1 Tax=Ruminococcus sp. TaxID=41978 RepID=UPI001B17F545|nr:glycosyltransferase family 2 protein [Ruminococcus sp.]MBO7472459.1 glycosyltransferase family 2 protein [Ruminococcus sp.]
MVSVIIPVYNAEKYLRECVDSVINQTYRNLEIILVDDGSPDNCGAICEEYVEKDSRVIFISKENSGPSDTRNVGFAASSGEYIYFLDSDDSIRPNTIELLVERIERENADLVCFDAETVFEDFEYPDYFEKYIRSGHYKSGKGSKMLVSQLRHKEYYSCVVLLFLKREFIERARLSFCKGIVHEDELYTLTVFLKAAKIAHLKKALYVRRLRAGSIMSGKNSLKNFEGLSVCIMKFFRMCNEYTKESIERKILIYYINEKTRELINIYSTLTSADKKKAEPTLKKIKSNIRKLGYCHSVKLWIKLHGLAVYPLYKRMVFPYKERLFKASERWKQ